MGVLRENTRISRLDRRITLREATVSTDSFGVRSEGFTNLDTVWASVEYGTSKTLNREGEDAGRVGGFLDVVFTVRFREDVDLHTNILYKDEVYKIHAITELGYRQYTQMFTEKQT